jgi:hypothetical protein
MSSGLDGACEGSGKKYKECLGREQGLGIGKFGPGEFADGVIDGLAVIGPESATTPTIG